MPLLADFLAKANSAPRRRLLAESGAEPGDRRDKGGGVPAAATDVVLLRAVALARIVAMQWLRYQQQQG